jgi:hypothetical protein
MIYIAGLSSDGVVIIYLNLFNEMILELAAVAFIFIFSLVSFLLYIYRLMVNKKLDGR